MKLSQFVKAAPALDKLFAANLDLSVSYQLHKRLPEFTNCFNLYNTELKKINESYKGDVWDAKMQELYNFDVEYDMPPIVMKIKDGMELSVNDLITLEPFVKFEEV